MKLHENEVFALRNGELVGIVAERPTSGRWIAIMARRVEMPPGEREPVRQSDQAPVEQAAILACEMSKDGRWQWAYLSQPTKETLGDRLFDCNAEFDRWYYVSITEPDNPGEIKAQ